MKTLLKKITPPLFFMAIAIMFMMGDIDETTQYGFTMIQPAEAVVGRPATPGSVAGVKRRTRRRTAAVTATAVSTPVVVGAPVAVGTTVAVLPSGCTNVTSAGVTYFSCGGVYYKPVFSGSSVTYTVVNAP